MKSRTRRDIAIVLPLSIVWIISGFLGLLGLSNKNDVLWLCGGWTFVLLGYVLLGLVMYLFAGAGTRKQRR